MARISMGVEGPESPSFEEGEKLYELAKTRLGSDAPDEYSRLVTLSPSYAKAVYFSLSNLRGRSMLSEKLFEAIGVIMARELGCDYLADVQIRALEQILGQEQARDAADNMEESAVFDEREKTILRLARKLARSPELITEATFDALRGLGYSDPQIMEILSTAGMFVMNATVISALSLDPP
jgi:uncharacterized peroxidase-related enzyme